MKPLLALLALAATCSASYPRREVFFPWSLRPVVLIIECR